MTDQYWCCKEILDGKNIAYSAVLCEIYQSKAIANSLAGTDKTAAIVWGQLRIRDHQISSAEEIAVYLAENPTDVYYILETPIETAITADEIAAFLALKAYSGTTIITNDADAYMEVGYKASKI